MPSRPTWELKPTVSFWFIALLAQLLQYPTHSSAYSWYFKENPRQCGNLTITITGSDGKPPYRVLIIPFGPTPLANNVEARRILDIPFDGNADSVSFKLKYPENSQLVTIVSDSGGFGSGGTSVAAQVTASSDSSCFDATTNVQPDFFFSIEPPNQIVQCVNSRIWWEKSSVQGTPNFLGVIPGGQSFAIPQSTITDVSSQGTGFSWKPNLRTGTTLIIVGGDNRGNGTAGSSLNVVSAGVQPDGSCLDANSPSSTPGSPAGGSYPTSTSSNVGGGSTSGGSNTGAIVGGVIGGLVLLIVLVLLLWFFRRRQRFDARQREKPVDLLNAGEDEDDDGDTRQSRNDLPQFYQPQPFTVPDPTLSSTSGHETEAESARRPLSGAETSFYTRSGTPDGSAAFGYGAGMAGGSSTGGRKGGPPRAMRPVNIIQHDDAGPSLPLPPKEDEEPETIELPPAYTALKNDDPPPRA